jgi:hypothetical protein
LDLTSIERIFQTPAVLHVPYTFFPDACGGTEVYVRGLAQGLASRGAPGVEPSEYVNNGLAVYRFASDRRRRVELAYGAPDEIAAEDFRAVLRKTRPRIVHFHARTSAISERPCRAWRSEASRTFGGRHSEYSRSGIRGF